ncbi:MAG: glutamate--tRNA ligase [Cytophagaceae bacterium]|jgi:glutamyl-tRNA synthetase|nr:glutamate--tRNA ligase [Cytophagaceae bacterium]
MSDVRVRFAPSPTGPLHIGGVRTALYNYLFSKKHGGKMLLRIEDTDQTRFVPGAENYILEALQWVGITIDEGPTQGGPHAPYRQSERKPMYRAYAEQLIAEGNAYYAFDTEEELEAMKERLKAAKVASPSYNMVTRMQMNNSLTLPEDEVKRRLDNGEAYVIRLKVPRKEEIRLNDLIRGWVVVHSSTIDDKVLLKSDGMPTYHLANIVDDHLMGITHVIRGEEWLPSAPLHVLLYRFLGWESTMPKFAHLPLLLKPDGNGKLSKRDADAGGFPVFPIDWKVPGTEDTWIGFRDQGYLQEAVVNFLAFLGWNPGTQEELFTMEQLIQEFSIERIGKSGTKFDINKAKWYNQQYLRLKSDAELQQLMESVLQAEGVSYDSTTIGAISLLLKERVTFAQDFWTEGKFFFQAPLSYDSAVASSKWNSDAIQVSKALQDKLQSHTGDLSPETAKHLFHEVLDEQGIKIGKVMQAVRLAITGVGAGPDLMHIISILGKDETVQRLQSALSTLSETVKP